MDSNLPVLQKIAIGIFTNGATLISCLINDNLVQTGVDAVLARPLKTGDVAYIPPWWLVKDPASTPASTTINFGSVKNAGG